MNPEETSCVLMCVVIKSQTRLKCANCTVYKHEKGMYNILSLNMAVNVRILKEPRNNKLRVDTYCNKSQTLSKCAKHIDYKHRMHLYFNDFYSFVNE